MLLLPLLPPAFLCLRAPGEDHELSLVPKLGLPLLQAFVEFENNNYDKAVELLYPVRYQLVEIGGSNAQVCILGPINILLALSGPVILPWER